jgi:hypothetical protein
LLHPRQIGTQFKLFAIAEPDPIVRLAFPQLDAFSFEARAEFVKGLVEEAGEEEERGALIEAVAFRRVNETAAAAGEVVLFEDGDVEAGMGEAGGGACTANTCAWEDDGLISGRNCRAREVCIPMTMAVFRRGLSPIEYFCTVFVAALLRRGANCRSIVHMLDRSLSCHPKTASMTRITQEHEPHACTNRATLTFTWPGRNRRSLCTSSRVHMEAALHRDTMAI